MAIYRYTVYKSPNIGIFVRANDSVVILPHGFAETKSEKLAEYLGVEEVFASVAGTRLMGPMAVMNNNGVLLPSTAEDEEVQFLRERTRLRVERLDAKLTAVGNLISANDRGAVVSRVPRFSNGAGTRPMAATPSPRSVPAGRGPSTSCSCASG